MINDPGRKSQLCHLAALIATKSFLEQQHWNHEGMGRDRQTWTFLRDSVTKSEPDRQPDTNEAELLRSCCRKPDEQPARCTWRPGATAQCLLGCEAVGED